MFDFIGTSNPAPAGCLVEFTLYGDATVYSERSENVAWHVTKLDEGRVRQYRVVSGGKDWGDSRWPADSTGLEYLLSDGTVVPWNASYREGARAVGWRRIGAPFAPASAAAALLGQARKHMEDRAATYDQPEGERSMGKTVEAFNVITGRDLSESEGWLLMQILKDVRDRQRAEPHRDSLEDGIAYSALKAEARLAGR